MTYIEQVLKENSKDKELSILVAQWEFDERSIPSALKAIIAMFPHYSSHDETHSICILNNIVKMLGEDAIKKMSCTDLWLLLESAYCHDMGMIITADEQQREIDSEKFLKFFKMIANDTNHPLQKYTEPFELSEDGTHLNMKEQTFDIRIFEASRYLLAEYFRSMHASMSKSAIKNPWESIGLQSPRSIIPNRLYSVLGDICEAHTKGFDSVLDLPTTEDGIGIEEAHPMFIACLLRLGDLLDIDNTRFSETLLRTIKCLPKDSELHIAKHKSISHLSINERNVEIEANCTSPQIAKVTQDWFNWIREEFNNQSQNWNKIVPATYKCHLPTINFLRIEMEGYEKIEGKSNSRFNIDTPKALELLQGENFYKNEFDAIREILQNAVDSTLLRIYKEAIKDGKTFKSIDNDFLDFAKRYPITVLVETLKNGNYKLTITDKGIGLKRDQLQYLTNTGSASNNIEKASIVDEMPEWMRPSGVFGIGFQSVFLLTDMVEIKTKDYFEDGKMWIEMHSPNGPMGGDIYLHRVNEDIETGFSISFVINKEIKYNSESKYLYNESSHDLQGMDIEHQIRWYGESSFVPIHIKREGDKFERNVEREKTTFFDAKTNVELTFSSYSFSTTSSHITTYLYRNASVTSSNDLMFVHPTVNVHASCAKNVLELNRRGFKNPSVIKDLTIRTIVDFIKSEEYAPFLEQMGKGDSKKSTLVNNLFALFLKIPEAQKVIQNDFPSLGTPSFQVNWKYQDGSKQKREVTLEEIINKRIVLFDNQPMHNDIQVEEIAGGERIAIHANTMSIGISSYKQDLSRLIFILLAKTHKRCCCLKKNPIELVNEEGAQYKFADNIVEEEIELDIETIRDAMLFKKTPCYTNYVKGFDKIMIPSKKGDPHFSANFIGGINFTQNVDKILLPYVEFGDAFSDGHHDEFCKYVSEQTGTPKEEVFKEYERLMGEINKV